MGTPDTVLPASTGLEYWKRETEEDVSAAAIARLVGDPLYATALKATAARALRYYDAEPALNNLFADAGTFSLGMLAFYLEASGGITHRRLAELGKSSSILSRGRASAILAAMRLKGLVSRGVPDQLGGAVSYAPDPRLQIFFSERFRIELASLAAIEPALAEILERWDARNVFPRFIVHLGAGLVRAGNKKDEESRNIDRIGAHRAGFLILYDLILRAEGGEDAFDVPISEIARHFSVARSHVRKVLGFMEESGYLARGPGANGRRLLPLFHAHYAQFMAIFHAGLMAFAHDTMCDVEGSACMNPR